VSTTIYGIKNCDTMKKARAWLEANGRDYGFHDYRAEGIDARTLRGWNEKVGWEKLLNKSSTTFRALPDADKANLDEDKALRLMLAEPTMIKRPVLDVDGRLTVGFSPDAYAAAFAA
jgi:arsenate reductase